MADAFACSGCGLCLLVCPVWRETRDIRHSPLGRAKALQNGATPADVALSVQSCTLCGACEPACPEEIDLVGMVLGLRGQLGTAAVDWATGAAARPLRGMVLIADEALRARPELLARTLRLLDARLAEDHAPDISMAVEAGAVIPAERLERFLVPLRRAKSVVVADGLLLRSLRKWLPKAALAGLGEALSRQAGIRRALGPGDLYVIESRAYHGDYRRLVRHYDRLRQASGCDMNLDLQRIAIPAADGRWLLEGRKVNRIVVESLRDGTQLKNVSDCPVVHVAELADALG